MRESNIELPPQSSQDDHHRHHPPSQRTKKQSTRKHSNPRWFIYQPTTPLSSENNMLTNNETVPSSHSGGCSSVEDDDDIAKANFKSSRTVIYSKESNFCLVRTETADQRQDGAMGLQFVSYYASPNTQLNAPSEIPLQTTPHVNVMDHSSRRSTSRESDITHSNNGGGGCSTYGSLNSPRRLKRKTKIMTPHMRELMRKKKALQKIAVKNLLN